MKIEQTTGSATPLRLPRRARPAGGPPAPESGAAKAPASAEVRPFPEGADGTFDAAKVAAIREDIRAGRYTINPERIADGILSSARELITGSSS